MELYIELVVPKTQLSSFNSSQHILPPPLPLLSRAQVSSHYSILDLDALQVELMLLGPMAADDYNIVGSVELRVGHRFYNRESIYLVIKNYNICWRVEYRVAESNYLKYHCRCRYYALGCRWSIRVVY
ncbi:hypothetical protein AHAS_Ahas20G0096000 [Arachis hypogaea]